MKRPIAIITAISVFITCMSWAESIGECFRKGQEAYEAKNYDKAIDCFEKAIVLNPMFAAIYHLLGNAYFRKGVLDEASAKYKQAITINPTYSAAYFNLAFVYHRKGMVDEAITEYKKVIAFDHHNAEAHFNLGLSYSKKGLLDEAISEYKEALKIDPDYPFAHYNLGRAYQMKGRKDPEFRSLAPIHYYKAGLLFLKQGSKDSALMAFEGLKLTGSKELEKDLIEKLNNI